MKSLLLRKRTDGSVRKTCSLTTFVGSTFLGVVLSLLPLGASPTARAQSPLPDGPAIKIDATEVRPGGGTFRTSNDRAIGLPNHPPLHTIPPLPIPDGSDAPEFRDDEGPGDGITYDPRTGRTTLTPGGARRLDVPAARGGGYNGADGARDTELDAPGGRMNGSMTEISNTADAPWRMNVKLVMRFEDAFGNDQYFVCSGTMRDAETVLTAGHCVYNRSSNLGWAKEIWVYPGWDGMGDIIPANDSANPYGLGHGTLFHSWTSWTQNGDYNYDVGAIEITRAVGMMTGWFGWSYGGSCSFHTGATYNNASYPAENCDGTLHNGRAMYYWFGNFDSCYSTNQLQLDTSPGCLTAIWGGMSGSGAYYIENDNRFVHAITSTSNRSTVARYARQWESWVNYTNDTVIPQARGASFDLQALDTNCPVTSVVAGSTISGLDHLATNPTNGSSNKTFQFNVYLSSNDNISSSDTLLSTQSYSRNFGAMSSVRINMADVTIPSDTPAGTYYLGVEYNSTTDGNSSNNDTDTWDAVMIEVTSDDCAARTLQSLPGELLKEIDALTEGLGALALMRSYRDEIMKQSPVGTQYVDLYYVHTGEISQLLLSDRELAYASAALMTRLTPKFEAILSGQPASLSDSDNALIEALINRVASQASPELNEALERFRADLAAGKLDNLLGPAEGYRAVTPAISMLPRGSRMSVLLGEVGGVAIVGGLGLVWIFRRRRF